MSSEPLGYTLSLIGITLGLSIALGYGAAWVIGFALSAFGPRYAQSLRLTLGIGLPLLGIILWRMATFNFITDALIFGLGIGFLVEAARHRGRRLSLSASAPME